MPDPDDFHRTHNPDDQPIDEEQPDTNDTDEQEDDAS